MKKLLSKKDIQWMNLAGTGIALQERIRLRSISLSISVPENLPPLMGNEIQMEQILINLFQNSLDAFEDNAGGMSAAEG